MGIKYYNDQKTKKQLTQITKQYSQDYKDPNATDSQATVDWQEYKDKMESFSLRYPQDWHVFADDTQSEFKDVELENSEIIAQGNSIFFSNKDSIDYTDESRLEDFRLLGLIEYEKANTDLDQLANSLGFTEEVGTQSFPFQANNLVGKEYISLGATEDSPRSAIIFKNNDHFYVFHLGFVGNDKDSLKMMEEIVGTFGLGKMN